MVRVLSRGERKVLLDALEESSWADLLRGIRESQRWGKDWGWRIEECSCTHRWLCDYCSDFCSGVFSKLGWCAQDTHWVIGVRKPGDWLSGAWFSLRFWWRGLLVRLGLREGTKLVVREGKSGIDMSDWFEDHCPVFDSDYFVKSSEWSERKCLDEDCMFCSKRPGKHRKNCKCLKLNE